MSAPKRIPDARILAALTRWRGDVSASAQEVGMSRNNLYARIKTLGLDLAAFRGGAAKGVTVQSAEGLKGVRARARARLCPAVQDRLREAKWDLQALYRRELDETAILEAFVQEAFDPWVKAKLAEKGGR